MSKWIGYAVSVNCGEPLGCYQGTILEADGTTITLTKAFRNGFPYPKSQVTLNAADIKELNIIEAAPEPAEQPRSTVAVAKNKKGHRTTVCETLQASHYTENLPPPPSCANNNVKTPGGRAGGGAAGGGAAPARSKPIDIQGVRPNKNNNHSGSLGNAGSTPKARSGGGGGGGGGGKEASWGRDAARRRNEACFGAGAAGALHDDFDFEGNLALFDKRALWEQMRGARPDLLRTAPDHKYRHDENVLGGGGGSGGAVLRAPPELAGARGYVTDEGAAVGGAAPRLRRDLWDGLQRLGLLESARTLLARAAADVALRLVGGGRRLEARNAHQAPRVVALCGAHGAGAAGLAWRRRRWATWRWRPSWTRCRAPTWYCWRCTTRSWMTRRSSTPRRWRGRWSRARHSWRLSRRRAAGSAFACAPLWWRWRRPRCPPTWGACTSPTCAHRRACSPSAACSTARPSAAVRCSRFTPLTSDDPRPPVTSPRPPVTSPRPPVTSPRPPVTSRRSAQSDVG